MKLRPFDDVQINNNQLDQTSTVYCPNNVIDFQKNNFKMPIHNSYKFNKLGFKTVKFNI